jgi:hypothetical protein
MAALDDDDDGDLPTFISAQPVLSYIKTFLELKNEKRQNEIVHDIINMKHLLNENDHDDEFIAIMHNPNIFEQVLYNDHQKVIFYNSQNISKFFLFLIYNISS